MLITSSSKHTFRRSKTGESANVTDFCGTLGLDGTGAGLFETPLYAGGFLYGGALIEGFIEDT